MNKFINVDQWTNRWKGFCEGASIHRILSTYLLSQGLSFPGSERFQINMNTFLRCLAQPKCPIGNILILQGGVRHMNSDSYYIRTACSFTSPNIRIFLYEKLLPMINFEFAHDVEDCLKYIGEHFSGPTVVVGYSMGGILLLNYLAIGYDSADLYIPTCCPIDLNRFFETISQHSLFKFIQSRAYSKFQVEGYEQLLELAGTNVQHHKKFVSEFVPRLNEQVEKWAPKTIYIVSEDDPITAHYLAELEKLIKKPLTYKVENGWHCCLNSTFLSVKLACQYLTDRSKGLTPCLDEISVPS